MEKRLLWPDVLRSFAIFLIVLVHTAAPQDKTWLGYLMGFIYSAPGVGISLFVAVSGAMLLGKSEPYSVFFSKRIKRVFIPWFSWTIIYMLVSIFLQGKSINSFYSLVSFFHIVFFSGFWFLPMIFGLYILTPILRVFTMKAKKYDVWYFLLLWAISVVILPAISLTFGLSVSQIINSTIIQFLGVYVLGYALSNIQTGNSKINYLWFLLFFTGLAVSYFEQKFLQVSVIRLSNFPYLILSPEYLLSTAGIFMGVFALFRKRIVSNPLERLISQIGGASIGIYLTHELFARFVFVNIYFAHPIFGAVIIFCCSFIFVVLLRKIPFVKYIVG
jgi:surface polysaccharide O-acyltransferase-like enzyme